MSKNPGQSNGPKVIQEKEQTEQDENPAPQGQVHSVAVRSSRDPPGGNNALSRPVSVEYAENIKCYGCERKNPVPFLGNDAKSCEHSEMSNRLIVLPVIGSSHPWNNREHYGFAW